MSLVAAMSSRAFAAAHHATVARRAAPYGIVITPADAKTGKKYRAQLPDGSVAFFGQHGAEDFIAHGDEKKRAAYRARAEGLRLSNGMRAIDSLWSPAWLSYNLLW